VIHCRNRHNLEPTQKIYYSTTSTNTFACTCRYFTTRLQCSTTFALFTVLYFVEPSYCTCTALYYLHRAVLYYTVLHCIGTGSLKSNTTVLVYTLQILVQAKCTLYLIYLPVLNWRTYAYLCEKKLHTKFIT